MTIPAGQFAAFVGPSGSGKSTMVRLLLRFYDPSSGKILMDDVDIRRATHESLLGQAGSVFQDTFLFDASIRENLRLARPEATHEEILSAAKAAEIHDAIMDMPEGYDTVVGEGGGRLSGGQRQRLAIARAMLRNPSLLVLDEPTSALDPGAESAIMATLAKLAKGRTVVMVTHRLASVIGADQICVFERGELVQQGTHTELVGRSGLYARLWEQQSGGHHTESRDRTSDALTSLAEVPLFRDLERWLLDVVGKELRTEHFKEGQVVIREGEPGHKFYVIAAGKVEVSTTWPTGRERRLTTLGEGDYFGEIALLDDVPRTATVRALVSTDVVTLEREPFFHLLDTVPELRKAVHDMATARSTGRNTPQELAMN